MALRKCIYFNSLALFIAFVLFLVPLLPPPGTAPSYLTFCLVKVVARRAVLAYFSLLFWFTLAVWFHLPSTKSADGQSYVLFGDEHEQCSS